MFGTESTENLYFSVSAGQLGRGLDEQLTRFVTEHSDTKLIIIDTLQKVREVGDDNYSYANDYQIMARLKSFADTHGIYLLLVKDLAEKENVTEKLKAENQMMWVQCMNNIRNRAAEVVNADLIYA
jgi:archaellum biogenesis ATPase FlaH